ncbi:MAG: hypothetical protein HOP19_24070 [Acidobacteria bacterium]|nr:hypothetical protein [Acidobacteriota bacterium]
MKRTLFLSGLCAALCLALFSFASAQRRPAAKPTATPSAHKVSGPYAHKNLSVFLIHGSDQTGGKTYLTLQEAMRQKKVVVHETKNVNQLAIENVSNEEIYVQSGDIVKGGQQDRVLSMDIIVPPRSGRMPIAAFCVEQGRWSKRANEGVMAFSASEKSLNSKDLKLAAKRSQSQQEVWRNVAVAQGKLAKSVNAPVAAADSATSLQLTLENKTVTATAQEYMKTLTPIIADKPDVIGYAFAINGEFNSADVYASPALFRKLWNKLLEASAIEAIGELDQHKPDPKLDKVVTVKAVEATLADAERGTVSDKDVTPRVKLRTRENKEHILFETRDQQRKEAWVHRNYVKK